MSELRTLEDPIRYPSSEELIVDACQATGLSDFGPSDFREGLDVLLRSLEHDANFSAEAALDAVALLRRRLVNRLEIEAHYRAHPEVAQLSIEGPVSITGLPRTGTTALGNMMSLDDQFRCLRIWEQAKPCPPPVLGEEATDPRRLAAEQEFSEMSSDLRSMHIFEVDATTEDTEVLGLQFRAQQMTFPAYSYHAWWRDSDMRSSYAYHRRVALLLQSRRPPRFWLYKSPHMKFHLEDFLSAYPEARFIMTHRDPAKVVPSYVSLVASLFPADWLANNDPKKLGQHISEHLRIGMERAIAARERIGEHRFLDVHHHDFLADASGTLERIYDFLGLELRPQVRQDMASWREANHSGAHGAHRYKPEDYGLSADQVRAEYDFYIRRFDVQLANQA
jgi:Sulfotransferase family